jgi:hypothetical protein
MCECEKFGLFFRIRHPSNHSSPTSAWTGEVKSEIQKVGDYCLLSTSFAIFRTLRLREPFIDLSESQHNHIIHESIWKLHNPRHIPLRSKCRHQAQPGKPDTQATPILTKCQHSEHARLAMDMPPRKLLFSLSLGLFKQIIILIALLTR